MIASPLGHASLLFVEILEEILTAFKKQNLSLRNLFSVDKTVG